MVKIGQLLIKLGLLSWWFPSLYTGCHIPLGVWVQLSVTNDHHLRSLHNSNLWRSPQHTLQIDPMPLTHTHIHTQQASDAVL